MVNSVSAPFLYNRIFIQILEEEEMKMSKIDEIRAEMVKAMKNKEKDRKETLSMLLAALKNKAIDKSADLTP